MRNGERPITIRGLRVEARIGVTHEERSVPQQLLIDLRFSPRDHVEDPADDIRHTVDYHAVALRSGEITRSRERRLIETLAEDLAADLIPAFRLAWIEVTVRKFILPDTEWVSVEIRREVSGE